MEKFADEIKDFFQEKMQLYQTLKKVLEQEKKCIFDIDVEFLWDISERKNQLVTQIQSLRESLSALLEDHHISIPENRMALDFSQIIKSLPFDEEIKSQLKKEKVKLDLLKSEISDLAKENRRYVNEHLSIISDIFSTVVNSGNNDQYNPFGKISNNASAKRLIREEV